MTGIDAREEALRAAVAAGLPGVVAGVTDASRTLWRAAAGVRSLDTGEPVASDAVIALHSATKAVTATAALQCVEDGLLDLDAPARTYLPAIGELEVLEAIDDDGTARTRPPVREITARMLLLHTSGLAYDMFDRRYAVLARARRARRSATPLRDGLHAPLLHEPGERWTYGISLDWLGLIVAELRGQRLEDVFRERIFAPCTMTSTSFELPPALHARLVTLHRRGLDGAMTATRGEPPAVPELDLGGQGLFSTVDDYLAFLRVWLGDGSAPGGRVLRPETIAWAVRGVPGLEVTPLPAAIPALTRAAEFLPGARKSWAYSFLVNDDDVPCGRRAGSLSWAGLANVFYWVDRATGVAAVWTTQSLPFFDPPAATAVADFERAVYRTFNGISGSQ